MKQYHEHLKAILERGTRKNPSREGMPGSISLFGYQNNYELSEGFPILTTKKVSFKNIVVELLWFLRGDTNIKYLVDNGCNIWNEDAYNYYCKICKENSIETVDFNIFIQAIKENRLEQSGLYPNGYKLGDCGFQYGRVWRNYGQDWKMHKSWNGIDQIKRVITSLKNTPDGRRHIVTAIDPIHDEDLALYWCHCMFQFNTRELTLQERQWYYKEKIGISVNSANVSIKDIENENVPKYYLDCQLYQRSADMFLGVPYNISSYALLTEIIARICHFIPGKFIHTFGDSHIYDNHIPQVEEILIRDTTKYKLPKLSVLVNTKYQMGFETNEIDFSKFISSFEHTDFILEGYESYPAIKAELSTGLKK